VKELAPGAAHFLAEIGEKYYTGILFFTAAFTAAVLFSRTVALDALGARFSEP